MKGTAAVVISGSTLAPSGWMMALWTPRGTCSTAANISTATTHANYEERRTAQERARSGGLGGELSGGLGGWRRSRSGPSRTPSRASASARPMQRLALYLPVADQLSNSDLLRLVNGVHGDPAGSAAAGGAAGIRIGPTIQVPGRDPQGSESGRSEPYNLGVKCSAGRDPLSGRESERAESDSKMRSGASA